MKLSDKQRDTLRSLIGEGVHTGLRKVCDSKQSSVTWRAIADLPDIEWTTVIDWTESTIADYFNSAEFVRDGKTTEKQA